MDLVDRYLHAVRGYLPRNQQDDIVRELGEDVRSQIDEREAALGRPLLDAELETFIKQLGHPMVLASRFGPQRHLIGPPVFPFYALALKVSLGIALIVQVVVAAVLLASGRPGADVAATLARFPTTLGITVFGWVTLVFAVAQLGMTHGGLLDAWQPRTLPRVQPDRPRASRLHALLELVGHVAFLAWLAAAPYYPFIVLGPAAGFLEFGPALQRYYPAILLLVLGWMAPPIIALARPERTRLRLAVRMAIHVAAIVLLGLMLDAGRCITLIPGHAVPDPAKVLVVIDLSVRIAIVGGAMAALVELVRDGWRYRRARPDGAGVR